MSERPFDAIRRALSDISQEINQDSTARTRLDPHRQERSGIPEIIYAQRKTSSEVISSLRSLATANGRALATRCPEVTLREVKATLADEFEVEVNDEARAIVVSIPGRAVSPSCGKIAVVTAGSSDAPVAAEAAIVAREMGVTVLEIRDVGVAGLHRLVAPLEQVVSEGVDAIVVAAGMDGALPSVVKGLVAIPVIGLPTSTGYGYGGDGTAALMSMLQSCAPGLSVVNIDNGVGAGATAALIAKRASKER